MDREQPLVLASSASLYERRSLEMVLKSAGFEVRGVTNAEDATDEVASRNGYCVLVIDSGLLEMHDDGQWRLFRARHPELGTVIRCWIRKEPGIEQIEEHTFLVHPDHVDGLLHAVRKLGEATASE